MNKKTIKLITKLVIIMIILPLYWNKSRTLPITKWDEFSWVGRSYFFEYYIKKDFANPIWQTYYSYNQPKLAEYIYGLWLQPYYKTQAKLYDDTSTNYHRFLISKGFYEYDRYNLPKLYQYQQENTKQLNYPENVSGSQTELINQYGEHMNGIIQTIWTARIINIFLLIVSIIFLYNTTYLIFDNKTAAISTIMFSLNNLIINDGLIAHSEALFILTFNASIYYIIKSFQKNKLKNTILFSIFSGLCFSTKLNGIMTYLLFIPIMGINTYIIKKIKPKIFFKQIIISGLIILSIFIILNPFTYPAPIKNTIEMFVHRKKTAISQIYEHGQLNYPSISSRMHFIFNNFLNPKNVHIFNDTTKIANFSLYAQFPLAPLILFTLGLIHLLKLSTYQNIKAVFLLLFLLTTLITSFYLILNWNRYFFQFVPFFTIIQTLGFLYIFNKIKNVYK